MAVYTTKLGDKICEATATSSIGLRHICKQLGLPYSTVTSWIYKRDHELCKKYAQAKLMQLHHLAEEILEIADDSTNDYMTIVKNGKSRQVQNKETISRSRLRIQARMNLISKLAPILREQRAGKYAGQSDGFPLRRIPWPGEKPGDYEAFLKQQEDQLAPSAAEQEALGSNKNEAGANSKKMPSSSPKTAPKPAPQQPSQDRPKSFHKYYDQRTGMEIPAEIVLGWKKESE